MKTKEKLSDLEVVPFTEFNREELFDLIAWAEALVADGVATGDTDMMDSRDRITVSPDHYHFEEEIVTKTITTTETKTVRRI